MLASRSRTTSLERAEGRSGVDVSMVSRGDRCPWPTYSPRLWPSQSPRSSTDLRVRRRSPQCEMLLVSEANVIAPEDVSIEEHEGAVGHPQRLPRAGQLPVGVEDVQLLPRVLQWRRPPVR